MSGGDGMDSNTQVPLIRCAWVHMAMSYHGKHSMLLSSEDPAPVAFPGTESLGCGYQEPGYMSS
jgi:hypothetical protein